MSDGRVGGGGRGGRWGRGGRGPHTPARGRWGGRGLRGHVAPPLQPPNLSNLRWWPLEEGPPRDEPQMPRAPHSIGPLVEPPLPPAEHPSEPDSPLSPSSPPPSVPPPPVVPVHPPQPPMPAREDDQIIDFDQSTPSISNAQWMLRAVRGATYPRWQDAFKAEAVFVTVSEAMMPFQHDAVRQPVFIIDGANIFYHSDPKRWNLALVNQAANKRQVRNGSSRFGPVILVIKNETYVSSIATARRYNNLRLALLPLHKDLYPIFLVIVYVGPCTSHGLEIPAVDPPCLLSSVDVAPKTRGARKQKKCALKITKDDDEHAQKWDHLTCEYDDALATLFYEFFTENQLDPVHITNDGGFKKTKAEANAVFQSMVKLGFNARMRVEVLASPKVIKEMV